MTRSVTTPICLHDGFFIYIFSTFSLSTRMYFPNYRRGPRNLPTNGNIHRFSVLIASIVLHDGITSGNEWIETYYIGTNCISLAALHALPATFPLIVLKMFNKECKFIASNTND